MMQDPGMTFDGSLVPVFLDKIEEISKKSQTFSWYELLEMYISARAQGKIQYLYIDKTGVAIPWSVH